MSHVESPVVIEGAYVADLRAQPDVLRTVAGALGNAPSVSSLTGSLRDGTFKRVVLTGMGSSLHALYPLHLRLASAGVTTHWIESAELLLGLEPLYAKDTLLVAVSQSGESAEIVQILKRAGEFGHVIGVTNNAQSRLGRLSGTTLLLHAGTESTVSCKTYLSTLAVLHWLGHGLTGADPAASVREIEQAEVGVRDYLARWGDHVASLAPVVRGVESVFVTGRGASLATAGTGGLILKESTRRSAEGMSCAAFRHGPLEMANERSFVIIFAGTGAARDLNRKLYTDIVTGGGRAAFVSPGEDATSPTFRLPAVAPSLLPLVEILPVQMISLAIAARDGREAGVFSKASKITIAD